MRRPVYPDEEQDLAAYHSIVAAYARTATKEQAGALASLAEILFHDLLDWVRRGRKTSAPRPRTLKELLGKVKGRDGDLVHENNFGRAFRRFRKRLARANASDSHPYGVPVPDYRLRARFCGPALGGAAHFPEKVWLDFEVLPDAPAKRVTVLPVTSFLPPLPLGFCGRQQILEPILKRALGRKRSVVGFCGLPQVGKTAIATALAESYVATMGGVAAFVEVEASRGRPLSGDRVHRTLLAQLGSEENGETTESLRPRLFRELHEQTGVVVFDDVGDGAFLRELPAPPGWLFIVTSRVAAAVDGVRWFPVGGLDLADARSLLLTLSGTSALDASWEQASFYVDYHWTEHMQNDRRVSTEETTLDVFAALAYACDGLPGLVREAAATLANDPGLAVSDYLMRWTAEAVWASNLLSFDVLARFAAALDAVVADLDSRGAGIYRTISLVSGPITDQAVQMVFPTVLETKVKGVLGTLAAHGLLVWNRDEDAYHFPALVRAHATASLRRDPEELARTEKRLTRFLAHNIGRLRDDSMPQPEREGLTAWLRKHALDVKFALQCAFRELERAADVAAIETFDALSDAFAPSKVCPSTLIRGSVDRQALVESGLLYEGKAGFQSITAKSLYFKGIYSRNADDLERAALLTTDSELQRGCYEALLEATAASANAPLRRIAQLQTQIAEANDADDAASFERRILAMRLHVALGDFRTVDRMADRLRAQSKVRTPSRPRPEYSEASVVLALAAALRRRWPDVRKHASRAARFERFGGVATALHALGLAGLGERMEARRLLSRIMYPDRFFDPATQLLRLTAAATHLLLGEGDRACALFTLVADAEVIPYDRRRGAEAYRAIALLLRANCQRMLGRTANARIDGARSLELLREQHSRLWRIVGVLSGDTGTSEGISAGATDSALV